MSQATVDATVIQSAVELACRAPSLHNSQPWRWVAEAGGLQLFADPSRIGHHTDSTGREVILSCGAVLDHLRVAMAAAGWQATIDRFPNPNNHDHLAAIDFQPTEFVSDAERTLADAIRRRRTDRLPFAAPADWDMFETVLRTTFDESAAYLDVIDDDTRPALADASRMTEELRRRDPSYEAELLWWTGYTDSQEGIPPTALVSESEAQRVDVARAFPTSGDSARRAELDRDHSKILVLSTYDDSRDNVLRCGEVLSTVLLEATVADMATCTLTHLIEINAAREVVRRQIARIAEPQVLVRVGRAPQTDTPPPPTPRRALTEVLEIR
jgi:hypothetical protein